MDLSTVKDIATVAAPLTGAIVTAFLKPKLEAMAETLKKITKNIEHEFIDKFTGYLNRSYERQSYLRTVVFQNNKRLLHELYIPLTVVNPNTEESIKITSYPQQLLPTYGKVLLVDTAGMGKSTVSRYLFLKVIEENHGIPIFVELRQLNAGVSILDLIHNDVSELGEVFDKSVLLKLIGKGDFIFFFDGFDEIPLKEREIATQHLQEFIAKVPSNKFLITSRQDPALTAFADFQRFVIKPLRQNEAFALLEKYDGSGTTSKSLIAKLKREQNRDRLKIFMINPLLVSLLFKAYDFKPTLPMRADVFYRQVYEALFENHDLSKGGSFIREKNSKLNIDDFAQVLRVLAMRTVGLGKVQYTSDELLGHVRESKRRCSGLVFSESDFVKDLTSTVPLFVQEGLDYRWNHKSFQEYFAALFISVDAKGDADIILQKLVDSKEQDRFVNIIDLYYDIDQVTFQRALTKRLVDEFIEYMDGDSYDRKYKGVDKEDVLMRKLMCFGRRYVLFSETIMNKSAGANISNESVIVHKIVRNSVQKKRLMNPGERIGSSTHYPSGGALVAIHKPNVIIMEVLNRKNNNLIVDMKTKLSKGSVGHEALPNNLVTGKAPVFVTEDIESSLNTRENFRRVTQMLIRNERVRISLNLEACRQSVAEIEEILSRDNISDFLSSI